VLPAVKADREYIWAKTLYESNIISFIIYIQETNGTIIFVDTGSSSTLTGRAQYYKLQNFVIPFSDILLTH